MTIPMTKNQIENTLWESLALDYNCSPEDFITPSKKATENVLIPGRRMYQPEPSALSLVSNGRSLIANCDPKLIPFMEEFVKNEAPEWVSSFKSLIKVEHELNKYDLTLRDMHAFFLPLADFPKAVVPHDIEITWYDQQEIMQFKDREEFGHALGFNERFPDMIAVSAKIDGNIVAMAGASRDWEKLWQIGINVLPEGEGRGLGALLTCLLKERILEMGIVPFYGTAVSHFASQNVARKAGFYPAWMEAYSSQKP